MYVLDTTPTNIYNVLGRVVVVGAVVFIALIRLPPIRIQRTWVYLTVSH